MNDTPTATFETRRQLERLRQTLDTSIEQMSESFRAEELREQITAAESVVHELHTLENCWTHTNLLSLLQTVDQALEDTALPPILRRQLKHTASAVDALQLVDPPGGIPW